MKFKDLFRLSLFTFYFNFKYFKFKEEIKLPVLIFDKVSIHALEVVDYHSFKLQNRYYTDRI